MANPLTTLQHVADELGITVGEDGARDRVLTRYIESASQALKELCGRNFIYKSGYSEDVAGHGSKFLVVKEGCPVTSITSVTYDDGNDTEVIDSDLYVLEDPDAGLIRHVSGTWRDTQTYVNHIEPARMHGSVSAKYTVVYEGGWVTPEQDANDVGTRDLPYDIEDAIIRFVIQKYKARQRDPSVSSMSVGSGSISYFDPNRSGAIGQVPASFDQVVRRYKRTT